MAEASDSRSAHCAQRQNPQLPLLHDAASRGELGVVSVGRRNLLGALAAAPLAAVAPASADGTDNDPDYELVRLGAECMLSLRDWSNCGDELEAYCQQRYWDNLRRFHAMKATTVAGLAMQLRVQFMDQCGNHWNVEAALTLELTEEQLKEIDGLDMQIFRLAQAASRVAASGRARA